MGFATCRLRWGYSSSLGIVAAISHPEYASDFQSPAEKFHHHHKHDSGHAGGEGEDGHGDDGSGAGEGTPGNENVEDSLLASLEEILGAEDAGFLGSRVFWLRFISLGILIIVGWLVVVGNW